MELSFFTFVLALFQAFVSGDFLPLLALLGLSL